MPTYKNVGESIVMLPRTIKTLDNVSSVSSNYSFQTYTFIDLSDYPTLTKTSDDPIYNPIVAQTTYTCAAGTKTITLDPDATHIKIYNIVDSSIDVYIQTTSHFVLTLQPNESWVYENSSHVETLLLELLIQVHVHYYNYVKIHILQKV